MGIADELREAERHIALAMSKLSRLRPGSNNAWVGSWAEYRSIGRLLCKTAELSRRIERKEKWATPQRKGDTNGR